VCHAHGLPAPAPESCNGRVLVDSRSHRAEQLVEPLPGFGRGGHLNRDLAMLFSVSSNILDVQSRTFSLILSRPLVEGRGICYISNLVGHISEVVKDAAINRLSG